MAILAIVAIYCARLYLLHGFRLPTSGIALTARLAGCHLLRHGLPAFGPWDVGIGSDGPSLVGRRAGDESCLALADGHRGFACGYAHRRASELEIPSGRLYTFP